jgi:two-component sensor histidine kinase
LHTCGRELGDALGQLCWEVWPGLAGTPVEDAWRTAMARRAPVVVEHRVDGSVPRWRQLRAWPVPVGLAVLHWDVTVERRARADLLARARRHALATREIAHRAMNGFAAIEAVLAQSLHDAADAQARRVLERTHARVRAMAAVQRLLFRQVACDTEVDLSGHLLALCDELGRAFLNRRIGLCLEAGILVAPEDAAAVAAIVAELVINAAKHAFPDPANAGQVLVHLSRHGVHGYRVEVEDDGCGLPAGFDPQCARGLGTGIVAAMARQLCGKVELNVAPQGTRFTLTVPS